MQCLGGEIKWQSQSLMAMAATYMILVYTLIELNFKCYPLMLVLVHNTNNANIFCKSMAAGPKTWSLLKVST